MPRPMTTMAQLLLLAAVALMMATFATAASPSSVGTLHLSSRRPSHIVTRTAVAARDMKELQLRIQTESSSSTSLQLYVLVDDAWDAYLESSGDDSASCVFCLARSRQYPMYRSPSKELQAELRLDNTHHDRTRYFFIVAADCALQAYGDENDVLVANYQAFWNHSRGGGSSHAQWMFVGTVILTGFLAAFLFMNCCDRCTMSYRLLLLALACHIATSACQAASVPGGTVFHSLLYLLTSVCILMRPNGKIQKVSRPEIVIILTLCGVCACSSVAALDENGAIAISWWTCCCDALNAVLAVWCLHRRHCLGLGCFWFAWHAAYRIVCTWMVPIYLHEHWIAYWSFSLIPSTCLFGLCLWEAATSTDVAAAVNSFGSDMPPLLSYSLTSSSTGGGHHHRWLLPTHVFASPSASSVWRR